jgi:hypothetical protein
MKLLDALVPKQQSTEIQRYVPPAWMQPYISGGMPDGWFTSYGKDPAEKISNSFIDYAIHGLMGNAVIASIMRVRVAVFSEARFQWQQLRKGRPGDMYGGTELELVERPWVGGTTGDLMARMLIDADLAGNSFWIEFAGELVRLRPDWVEIVFTPRWVDRYGEPTAKDDPDKRQLGWIKLGYLYYQGGVQAGVKPAALLPDQVMHFAPNPDPLATFRGMSWLTPVIREIQADTQATKHKLKFFENAATPNIAVKLATEDEEKFKTFVELMDSRHKGVEHAYETLYTGAGADVTVIGADMRQLDFKITQGAGESRLAAAGGVHPAIVGLSEGLQGSSLNAGNFGAARRLVADATMRPLWRNAAGSLEVLLPPEAGSRLWVDTRDVAFLREDAKDAAEIVEIQGRTITGLVREGFTAASAVAAVLAQNMTLLEHTDQVSVQLQRPGSDLRNREAVVLFEMIQKVITAVPNVVSPEELRKILNEFGANLVGSAPAPPQLAANGVPLGRS